MSLAAGTRLGPAEVLGLRGAWGMGEVYTALNPRLERTVAIEVLFAELSSDPDRRVRFAREAPAAFVEEALPTGAALRGTRSNWGFRKSPRVDRRPLIGAGAAR